jgi:transcriptional regulator with XRE-family HTH domain
VAAGLSQRKLGMAAGIDQTVAGTRISRYEAGVSEPSVHTVGRLARALGTPLAYFFCDDDQLAWIVQAFDRLTNRERADLVRWLDARPR